VLDSLHAIVIQIEIAGSALQAKAARTSYHLTRDAPRRRRRRGRPHSFLCCLVLSAPEVLRATLIQFSFIFLALVFGIRCVGGANLAHRICDPTLVVSDLGGLEAGRTLLKVF
jgi:hypothetical protein